MARGSSLSDTSLKPLPKAKQHTPRPRRTFIMDEGVRQGCAAAPFFFHLALSLALEQLDADFRKSVHCVADDVLICDSSPARIRAILDCVPQTPFCHSVLPFWSILTTNASILHSVLFCHSAAAFVERLVNARSCCHENV
jgi:hypothetical protein